jgi:sigma-B regulation protein RsbU (phosphoserine phosphatase)
MSDNRKGEVAGDILVVDDTPANLRLLAKMLSERGYRVRPVPDGALALAAARAEPPDLILLDIRMPEMDGYEVCERLRADDPTRDVPIIFISALDATEDKVRAFAAGGVDYVTKPFQVQEVMARVETHLALRRLQQQLQDTNLKMTRELALAGEVQASFLPHELPAVDGWQLSVTLEPARETSGDFYDVRCLADGRLVVLVADVVDKGVGAALFMALSSSLIRTYAAEHPAHPRRVLSRVNRRLLEDTDSNQFVTVFYGILDPPTGTLTYCNAGHCPPYLASGQRDPQGNWLIRTGMPLGILEDATWEEKAIRVDPGDVLSLYTDGITEAFNDQGTAFGQDRLLASVRRSLGRSAGEIEGAILADVHSFVGATHQVDDIALVVITREA